MEPMELQERTDMLISLTPAAAAKIRDLMAEDADVSVLRVAVEGGGCSGFQYGLGFDRGAQEGDHEFECEGVKVVVDPFSAPHLRGCSVDYLETIQESGFKIDNPNAVASCGCGSLVPERGRRRAGRRSRHRLRLRLQPLAPPGAHRQRNERQRTREGRPRAALSVDPVIRCASSSGRDRRQLREQRGDDADVRRAEARRHVVAGTAVKPVIVPPLPSGTLLLLPSAMSWNGLAEAGSFASR